jgi:hypothetical protein
LFGVVMYTKRNEKLEKKLKMLMKRIGGNVKKGG